MKKILLMLTLIGSSVLYCQDKDVPFSLTIAPKIDKAIAYHQPERLLELNSGDLAQLLEHKSEYLAKARESSDKAWEKLRPSFDFYDSLRITFGSLMTTSGLGFLYLTYKYVKPYLKPQDEATESKLTISNEMTLFCALACAAGLFSASMGALNLQKGLTKHDRFMTYYKALAVESNIQRWLAFFKHNISEKQKDGHQPSPLNAGISSLVRKQGS